MDNLHGLKKIVFYISFPLTFIGFILPIYALEVGASPIEIAFLYATLALCSSFLKPLVGRWIDRKGRRNGILVGVIGYSLVMLLFLVSQEYKYLILIRGIQGIASAFLWISIDTMVSDLSNEENRSKAFGIKAEMSNKGAMLGSFIGFNIFLNNISFMDRFTLIFSLYFVASLIAVFYAFTKVEETNIEPSSDYSNEFYINSKFKRFLLVLAIITFVGSIIGPMFLVYVRDYFTNDISKILWLFIPTAVLSMFIPSKLGNLADKYGREKMLILGLLLQGVTLFLIPFIKQYDIFILGFTVISIGGMMEGPAINSLVVELTGGKNRGKSYGYYSMVVGSTAAIGYTLGGYAMESLSYNHFFMMGAIAVLLSTLILGLLLKKNPVVVPTEAQG